MSDAVKGKMIYMAICLFSATVALALTAWVPVISSGTSHRSLTIEIAKPIIPAQNSIWLGMTKDQTIRMLGEPQWTSSGKDTFVYFRKVASLGQDQILVVKFAEDKVKMIDSNIQL